MIPTRWRRRRPQVVLILKCQFRVNNIGSFHRRSVFLFYDSAVIERSSSAQAEALTLILYLPARLWLICRPFMASSLASRRVSMLPVCVSLAQSKVRNTHFLMRCGQFVIFCCQKRLLLLRITKWQTRCTCSKLQSRSRFVHQDQFHTDYRPEQCFLFLDWH